MQESLCINVKLGWVKKMKLTREAAKLWIPVLEAYAEGKELEILHHYEIGDDGKINEVYIDVVSVDLSAEPECYRVKEM